MMSLISSVEMVVILKDSRITARYHQDDVCLGEGRERKLGIIMTTHLCLMKCSRLEAGLMCSEVMCSEVMALCAVSFKATA